MRVMRLGDRGWPVDCLDATGALTKADSDVCLHTICS